MKNNSQSSFLVGIVIGAIGLYLLGTKQGRIFLKKLMDAAEDFEGNADVLLEELSHKIEEGIDIEEFGEHLKEKLNKIEKETEVGSIHSVMERIKSVIPQKEVKKYIAKDGKFVK